MFLSSSLIYSETPVRLNTGVILSLPPRSPNSLLTPDPVEALLVTGERVPADDGRTVRANDTLVGTWRAVTADSLGWFRGEALSNAYVMFRYTSDQAQTVLLEGMGHTAVYVNGVQRSGNPYRDQDMYEWWGPRFDYSMIPVPLRKGVNEFLFFCQRGSLKAVLHPHASGLQFITADPTVPDLLVNESAATVGAMPVLNAGDRTLSGLQIKSWVDGAAPEYRSAVPLLPFSLTKVPFGISVPAHNDTGIVTLHVAVVKKQGAKEEVLAATDLAIHIFHPWMIRKETFISRIDGSVQYYAVNPPPVPLKSPALFLSLHGAGVEGINQAQAYGHKNWGVIVSPTNRRPYGYNWENWGRLDALEVLEIAKKKFDVDPSRVYLTGHSMGGHGTWQLGSFYPDRFGALGISAGWISIWSYRIRPLADSTPVRRMLTRSSKSSDTYAFATNLRSTGIYIIQGDADDNVPPSQPESMIRTLTPFHKDFIYHVEPNVGHWWDKTPEEEGTDCVDWKPMFDFFAHRTVASKEMVKIIDFTTANLAVASKNFWAEILRQQQQQSLSRMQLQLHQTARMFTGTTMNITLLSLDASMLPGDAPCTVALDGDTLNGIALSGVKTFVLSKRSGHWTLGSAPAVTEKYPGRTGNIREAFAHRPLFVYGTQGNSEENTWALEKARLDAEQIWYRGNSSLEVIPDKEFSPGAFAGRSVILIGNARTNSAWDLLLKDAPVRIDNKKITVGSQEFNGKDLACLFVRPRTDSDSAMVAVIAGTGIDGMHLTNLARYFDQYVNFPDIVLFDSGVLRSDDAGVVLTGYFGQDWSVEQGEFVRR